MLLLHISGYYFFACWLQAAHDLPFHSNVHANFKIWLIMQKKKSKEVLASDIVWHNCSYESHRLLALLIVKNANISSYTAINQSAVCSTMQPKSKAKKSQ